MLYLLFQTAFFLSFSPSLLLSLSHSFSLSLSLTHSLSLSISPLFPASSRSQLDSHQFSSHNFYFLSFLSLCLTVILRFSVCQFFNVSVLCRPFLLFIFLFFYLSVFIYPSLNQPVDLCLANVYLFYRPVDVSTSLPILSIYVLY